MYESFQYVALSMVLLSHVLHLFYVLSNYAILLKYIYLLMFCTLVNSVVFKCAIEIKLDWIF